MTAPVTGTQSLRIVVDREACVGHGRCYSVAPDVFTCDDEGFVELVAGDRPEGPELQRQARLAAQSCPERALTIEEL